MGINTSSSEYLSSRETGNTRKELDRLKKIIKPDNINFSEKDQYKNLDNAKAFDVISDVLFEHFMEKNRDRLKNNILTIQDKSSQEKTELLQKEFHTFLTTLPQNESGTPFGDAIILFNNTLKNLNKEKIDKQETALDLTTLELHVLENEILHPNIQNNNSNLAGFNATHGYHKDKDFQTGKDKENKQDQQFERENYQSEFDYIDAYDTYVPVTNSEYHNEENIRHFRITEKNIEDIYSDKRVAKVLEKVFDKEELKKRYFEINLSAEDGLASIILNMQKKAQNLNISISGTTTIFSIFEDILDKEKEREDPNYLPGSTDKLSVKDTKLLLKLLNIPYEKDGVFGDFKRLAQLFNNAERKDLITFANLVESRSNIARATKERYNNKEILDGNVLIDTNNVFAFLSDINSDGMISANKNRKNKEQFKYGDLGNISGQQLLFTINQAVGTQEVLFPGQGENKVVKNIAEMIDIMVKNTWSDQSSMINLGFQQQGVDIYSNDYKNEIQNLIANPTKENLVNLIGKYPQTKSFFLSAVEKISGGSSINQPDLYDVLTGQETKRLEQIDTTNEMENIRKSLDTYLRKNPELQKVIDQMGVIEVRETLLQQIMEKVDKLSLQISFDTGTNHDIIMNEASKTLYREQARKTILGDINIQQITLGTNLNEIKVSYQIGKSNISADGRTKYHIAGGPSFYLGKNGISAGLEASSSYGKLTNRQHMISASLSDIIDHPANYIGPEAAIGIKAGKEGFGAYVSAGVFDEKDHLMGISMVEKTYLFTSSRLFNLQGLDTFTPQSLKSRLESNLAGLEKGPYKNFISNNKNKLNNDINVVINYLQSSKLLEQINKTKKTPEEKQEALSSLLRIIQQGNIDQWKSDVIMNLHDKKAITKLSAGLSLGTWFFGTKTNNYTGNSTPGEGTELPNDNGTDDQTTVEGDSGSSGTDARISFLGVYVGARLSTWINTYLPNAKQVLVTEKEMNQGIIDEVDLQKDLNKYAKYLESMLNKKNLFVKVFKKDSKDYLEITYIPENPSDQGLSKLLNIHYLPGKENEFAIQGNRLVIGNVGPIAVYTTTLPGGVDRVLSLGTKNLKEAVRLKSDNIVSRDISGIDFKENGFVNFTKEKLISVVDSLQAGTTQLDANEKDLYKGLFDENGALVAAPTGVVYGNGLTAGQQFSTGTLTLSKKPDGTYRLDYQSSTDNKLHLNYKTLVSGQDRVEISGTLVNNPDLEEQTTFQIPQAKDIANSEYKNISNKELKDAFIKFTTAVINADFDKAINELTNLLSPADRTSFSSKTPEEKQYIVDNYVSLFAYEESYDTQTIQQLISARKEIFLDLKGPSKNIFKQNIKNDLLRIRKDFEDNHYSRNFKEIGRESYKNIFGYTAFYRTGLEHRGYAPTPFGKTNIIRGSLAPLKEENQRDGKQRIVDNLTKDKKHTELLIKQIKKAINNTDISEHLTIENIGDLILNGELEIPNNNSGNTIDISSKKLILNSSAIFYLLGECLNESLGLSINSISIQEKVSVEKEEKNYTAEGTPDPKYTSQFFGRSNSISGDIHSEREDLSLRGHKRIGEKTKKDENNYKGDGNSGEGDDIPGGDDDGIDGE